MNRRLSVAAVTIVLLTQACGAAPSHGRGQVAEGEPTANCPADIPHLTRNGAPPSVVDAGTGLDPIEVQRWGGSLEVTLATEAWALSNSREDVLNSGCIGDPRAAGPLFGDEMALIARARRDGATIKVALPALVTLILVRPSEADRAAIRESGQVPSEFAWIAVTRGPSAVWLVNPDGSTRTVTSMAGGEIARDFYGGEYRPDLTLGGRWFEESYVSCASITGKSLCRGR